MSAERGDKPGKNSAFPLTSDQAKRIAGEITEKWDEKRGLILNMRVLEKLMRIYGPDAKISDVLKDLGKQPKH